MTEIPIQGLHPNWSARRRSKLPLWFQGDPYLPGQSNCSHTSSSQEDARGRDFSWPVPWSGINKPMWDLLREVLT